ncbi:MAG TPA: ABC transporter ATP-binding protein [Vicinamibacterales bacterium]|nr:ABC transporter ATP-binding protein [Vicinamibacterales bacterium]
MPARRVIDDVSLDVTEGAAVGILGPNGSGKTTLMRLLSGGLRPQAGAVALDGADLGSFRPTSLARRIAVVPQETSLAFDYTALEIVLMGRYPHLGAFEIEGPHDLAMAEAALESTGTRGLAERAFRSLSGGEKQRVIIASALAQTADGEGAGLLLLDEPTASLDLRYQLEIGALVTRLRKERGITVVVSTHDLHFAAAVCTEIVMLADGRVLARGTPGEILTPASVGTLYGIDPAVAARFVNR